jgi:hypothetical protein
MDYYTSIWKNECQSESNGISRARSMGLNRNAQEKQIASRYMIPYDRTC